MSESSSHVYEQGVQTVPESPQTQQKTQPELEEKPSAKPQDQSQKDQDNQEKQQQRVLCCFKLIFFFQVSIIFF